jgi:hypothetical protein
MNEFPELRAALVAAAELQRALATGQPAAAPTSSRDPRRSWWRSQLRTVVLAAIALLAVAAVALAASGVFSTGRAVRPVSRPSPETQDGAAIPSTIHLLTVRAPDPAGGPAWGLRLARTTRGEVCITPGRFQDSMIGVLGIDRAFGDDGRLHPFARDYLNPAGCGLADANGHAYLAVSQIGVPSSALSPGVTSPAGGCKLDNPPPADRGLLCPTATLRDVDYGLLGPDATQLTYRDASGHLRHERPAGSDGAYLIVQPYTGGLQGNASIGVGPAGAPFVSVTYRNGRVCRPTIVHACQTAGYHPPQSAQVKASQVQAPIKVRVVRARSYCSSRHASTVIACNGPVPHGFSRITGGSPFVLINATFIARVPVTSSHSYYETDFHYSQSAGCTVGSTGGPTDADIHAGQRIHTQDLHLLSCPGPVHGIVKYVQASPLAVRPASSPNVSSLTVGRFTIDPTTPRH